MSLPTLFISHGSPALLIEDSAARDFLSNYARSLPKPRAIVIASAHFGTSRPAVVGDAQPGMIYDFGGMPELRRLVYVAPGDPAVALKVAGLLQAAGFAPAVVKDHGYDHGTWVPLMLLYPDADVPVVQLSVQPHLGPAHHLAIGRALASLADEDILLIGSGSATHNLEEFYYGRHTPDSSAREWVTDFTDWVHERIESGNVDELTRYRALAPTRSRIIRPRSTSCRSSSRSAPAPRATASIRAIATVCSRWTPTHSTEDASDCVVSDPLRARQRRRARMRAIFKRK